MKFKLNQRVYCKKYKKYGKIIYIDENKYYPIAVKFDDGDSYAYKADGRYYENRHIALTIPLEDKINKLMNL